MLHIYSPHFPKYLYSATYLLRKGSIFTYLGKTSHRSAIPQTSKNSISDQNFSEPNRQGKTEAECHKIRPGLPESFPTIYLFICHPDPERGAMTSTHSTEPQVFIPKTRCFAKRSFQRNRGDCCCRHFHCHVRTQQPLGVSRWESSPRREQSGDETVWGSFGGVTTKRDH